MGALVGLGLSVAVGMLLAIQAPVNALLGRTLAAPVPAALVSFGVSALGTVAITAFWGPPAEWRAPPPWLYLLGGALGIPIVIGGLTLVPKLGAASFLACVIFGQLAAGLVIDQLGAFGLERHELSTGRVAAVGLVLVGAVLLRVF